ncbi:azurin [Salinimonas chungwhensis]|uniref:azurin n=1 Tax=Salinimonas chungwhensis TaxID=265425 RepID=UPI000360A6B3|nr:azurin [Salinimonas chungwhensis]
MKKIASLFAGAALLASGAVSAQSNECETTIESNDAMQYNKKEIVVPASCEEFTLTLTHTGKMEKAVMGHNWVLTESGEAQAVATDGMAAGIDNGYLKPDDERIIANTDLIGGGGESSVTFSVSDLNKSEDYTFFCSFPGHISLMKGTLKVQ